MKKTSFIGGISLIAFALYMFAIRQKVAFIMSFQTELLLVLVGLIFLLVAYSKQGHSAYIVPAVMVTGIGLHLILMKKISVWPDTLTFLLLLLALALMLQTVHSKGSFTVPILISILAIVSLFFETFIGFVPRLAIIQPYWIWIVCGSGVGILLLKKS